MFINQAENKKEMKENQRIVVEVVTQKQLIQQINDGLHIQDDSVPNDDVEGMIFILEIHSAQIKLVIDKGVPLHISPAVTAIFATGKLYSQLLKRRNKKYRVPHKNPH